MMWAQSVNISQASGWLESAYITWQPVANAESYNVYYSGQGVNDQQIDSQLIRSYGSYFRADVLGLKAGSYTLKVAPVINGTEGNPSVSTAVTVMAQDRTGFAFHNGRVPGAYKADGTPKSGAVILYITENTKNTISLDVTGANENPCVGLQNILLGYKKGQETRPLIVRMVGQITDFEVMDKGDIVIENKNNASSYITLEGVGEDATADGWGIRVKNASNIEIRNIGTMNCDSSEGDNIGLQQNNDYVWVHHCDFFYGGAGGDSDQAKGDGALDCKKSNYVTFSYNHFWDSGKSNLLGLSESASDELLITYHHNWYDHSDSRHPRVRYYSAHVYNNYYDGIAKYGVGATEGSSLLVEGNYFRNCKYPILTSMQGSDVFDESENENDYSDMPTFSKEDGGSIKAVNNYMTGQKRFVAYGDANYANSTVDFDAYVVNSATDNMPSSVRSVYGSNTHDNFNTSSVMYSYTAQSPAAARNTVMQYAGRMNGGDFDWTFDNSVDDTSYDVNTSLKNALTSYSTLLNYVQGEGSGPIVDPEDPDPEDPDPNDPTDPVDPGDYDHSFTASGTSSSFYSISGNLSTSKGTVSYGGMTLTQCLKIESSTSISFSTSAEGTLTLVFNDGWSGNFKVDGANQSVSGGLLTVTLGAGSHTLTKGDSGNLYFMSLDLGDGGEEPTTYTLTTNVNGQGSVDPSSGSFGAGTSVTVTATPASGWQFDSWSGGYTGSSATFVMDDNKTITANFSAIVSGTTYTVSTSTVGQGAVSGAGTYAEGSSVTLSATAASGYTFSGWSGAASGNSNPLVLTVDSHKSITATFEAEEVVVGDGYFVATNGSDSNSGTSVSSPFKTLQKAIEEVSAGDYIYVRGGTHVMTVPSVVITKNGTASANIHVFAYGNEVPVLSFDDVEVSSSRGIVQEGDYWHWKGITIEKAGDNGMLLSGNNNTIEKCIFRKNHDTGLQLSRYYTDADEISEWPSNNLIVDCEAFDNADSDSEDADGFAAKLTSGTGNIFRRCVAHHNIDDGWDLYTKSDTGPIGIVIFEDCIAHNNGVLTDGNTSGGGDKNGFKLGSSAHNINHELRRCIAYSNGKHGFTDNGNVGNIKFYNLTSYDNGDYNFHTRDNASHTFINCISFDGSSTDRIVGNASASCNALTEDEIDWNLTASASDFVTMTPGPDANPTSNGFLNLKATSPLVNAGCSASGVSGNGTLDLGAIEYGDQPPVSYTLTTTINGSGSVNPSNGTYAAGTTVTMTATPAAGWQFDNWSGGSTVNPATVVMDANKNITANFSELPVTCEVVPLTSYVQINGGTWTETTGVALTAGDDVKFGPQPSTGGTWSWTGPNGFTADWREVTLTGVQPSQAGNYVAAFSDACGTYYLTVNVTVQPTSGGNEVTIQEGTLGFCGVDGSVDSNNAGYTGDGFANTTNALGEGVDYKINASAGSATLSVQYASATDRPANVLVNGTAVAVLNMPATGAWTTWSSVSTSINLSNGINEIRLEATSASGLGNIDYITVSGDGVAAADCNAVVVPNSYTLTTTVNGSGTVSGAGVYAEGTAVTVTATPASGWVFDSWSGGYTGTTATVVMDADKNVTATFVEIAVEAPGDEIHNFTESGMSSDFFSITGNLSTSKGTVYYEGLTLTQCLKIESSTSIAFETEAAATLTLVFNDSFQDEIKVNGTSHGVTSGVLSLALPAGTYELTKDDTGNLYYMSVSYDVSSARTLGIDDLEEQRPTLAVYPNPAVEQLTIASSDEIQEVQIYSLTGVLVHRVSEHFEGVDVSHLQRGHYLVRVYTTQGTYTHAVIKQ
ncbi:hypothetical protein BFP72_08060 [Reichenbachiella sp. 5M10]|nr:hypothetical protein BFP72_08060 [Reichenbachiella sp. 5M10]